MENPIKVILNSQSEQNTLFNVESISDADNVRYVVIKEVKFLVFRDGDVFRNMFYIRGHTEFLSKPHWRKIKHDTSQVRILDKMTTMARLIAHAWLDFDIDDNKLNVMHKDGNKDNNHVDNLIVADKSIARNPKAKGYSWHKNCKSWEAKIVYKGKQINLGYYKNEDDAKKAYAEAKLKYTTEKII